MTGSASPRASIDRVRYAAVRAMARVAGQREPTIEEFSRAAVGSRDLAATWNAILRLRSRSDPHWRFQRRVKRAAMVSVGLVLGAGLLALRLTSDSPSDDLPDPLFKPFAPIEAHWRRSP